MEALCSSKVVQSICKNDAYSSPGLPPGTSKAMLLPLSRIWSIFATTLLPSAVISLRTESPVQDGKNRNMLRKEDLGWG